MLNNLKSSNSLMKFKLDNNFNNKFLEMKNNKGILKLNNLFKIYK